MIRVGLLHCVEGRRREDKSLEEERILSPACFQTQDCNINSWQNLQPPSLPCGFQTCPCPQSHEPIPYPSLSLSITHTHTHEVLFLWVTLTRRLSLMVRFPSFPSIVTKALWIDALYKMSPASPLSLSPPPCLGLGS